MNIIAELRSVLPPVFLGTKIGELTGHAIAWGTVQNKRSRREIPDACFARTGTRVFSATRSLLGLVADYPVARSAAASRASPVPTAERHCKANRRSARVVRRRCPIRLEARGRPLP